VYFLYQIKSSAWRDANEVNRLAIQPVSDEMLHAFYYEIRGRDKQGCPSEYDDDLHYSSLSRTMSSILYSNLNEITQEDNHSSVQNIIFLITHYYYQVLSIPLGEWRTPRSFLGKTKSTSNAFTTIRMYFIQMLESVMNFMHRNPSSCAQFVLLCDLDGFTQLHSTGMTILFIS
jgi:hypothetical protein